MLSKNEDEESKPILTKKQKIFRQAINKILVFNKNNPIKKTPK